MKIKMMNLYGKLGNDAWYRKDGCCFSFCPDEKFASDVSLEECLQITKHANWYCDLYGSDKMAIIFDVK